MTPHTLRDYLHRYSIEVLHCVKHIVRPYPLTVEVTNWALNLAAA